MLVNLRNFNIASPLTSVIFRLSVSVVSGLVLSKVQAMCQSLQAVVAA